MSNVKYLGIHQESGHSWLEDSGSAITEAVTKGLPVKFYAITLDENNVPSLGAEVTLEAGEGQVIRQVRRRNLMAAGQVIGTAEDEVDI